MSNNPRSYLTRSITKLQKENINYSREMTKEDEVEDKELKRKKVRYTAECSPILQRSTVECFPILRV